MKRSRYFVLSVMMFLQVMMMGTTIPIMSFYLKKYLHFSGLQSGLIISMSALSSIVAPFIGALLADRHMRVERLFTVYHLISGILMLVLAGQTAFLPFISIYFIYTILNTPTIALSTAIIFHHLKNPERDFGSVRVWGTIGWIVAAWSISFFYLTGVDGQSIMGKLPIILKLSGVLSIVLAAYSLFLPRSPVRREKVSSFLPMEAIRVFWNKEVIVLTLAGFLAMFNHRIYYFGVPLYLDQLGFSESTIMPVMSIGQVPEIIAFLFLGKVLSRLGIRRVLLFGLFCDALRYLLLAVGGSQVIVYSSIMLHGLTYSFFMGAALIVLDGNSTISARAGVHQFYAILCAGVGGVFGNLISGWAIDFFSLPDRGMINFFSFWFIPFVTALIAFFIIYLFFRNTKLVKIG